jgi:hypothetical protein
MLRKIIMTEKVRRADKAALRKQRGKVKKVMTVSTLLSWVILFSLCPMPAYRRQALCEQVRAGFFYGERLLDAWLCSIISCNFL